MTSMTTDDTGASRLPRERSPRTVALDNLVRRKLRVSDPSNATEVATALKSFYSGEQAALEREAAGLPFFKVKTIRTDAVGADTATRIELIQAKQDVDRDLGALIAHTGLKDVQAELRGWEQSIRRIVADGTEAARFGLDPRQRDAAMAARRQLGAYARLARCVGAMTPGLNGHYRQLAKSLDEVAALIVVALGDAIAMAGTGGARFLLQAPASELQGRRDAVIYALRNLTGTTAEGYGPNDWPRGLVALRQFIDRLEAGGHTDLRVLFQEGYVARALDELVHYATSGAADDLRALAATAAPTLERFRRLIILATRLVEPESPPLAAYLSAVQFFLDAFEHGSSGARLLYIARPPIVFYGLYGMTGLGDPGTRRLVDLVGLRGQLAERLDCFMDCDCGPSLVRCQIVLDKLLFDLDRAIDLYVSGVIGKNGDPETRAAAYGVLIEHFLDNLAPGALPDIGIGPPLGDPVRVRTGAGNDERGGCLCAEDCLAGDDPILALLGAARDLLFWGTAPAMATARFTMGGFRVLLAGGGGVNVPSYPASGGAASTVGFFDLGAAARTAMTSIRGAGITDPLAALTVTNPPGVVLPADAGGSARDALIEHVRLLGLMHQELCIQHAMDHQWANLLRTMAPSCLRFGSEDEVLAAQHVLAGAIARVRVEEQQACESYTPNIPPHYETSLAGLTYLRNSEGGL